MSDIMNSLFGPLDKSYCVYFYYVSIVFFCFFLLSCFAVLKNLLSSKKFLTFTQIYIVLSQPFIMYFINRLYYSMCLN